MIDVPILILDAELPVLDYARAGDAGADLFARRGVLLEPGSRELVGTGIAIALPEGYAGLVVPRSGLAARHGVTCLNSPGLIDSGFRGELRVLLVNTDRTTPYEVQRGDRIAQLVILRCDQARFLAVEGLPETDRGTGGFGHTGR